jgi:hypothetical protein
MLIWADADGGKQFQHLLLIDAGRKTGRILRRRSFIVFQAPAVWL